MFLAGLAGWMNRKQQDLIDYLHAENEILKELCVKFAEENPSWGYDRIQGAFFGIWVTRYARLLLVTY